MKRAIVTGGNRGIGWAIAEALARAGVSVTLTSRRAADAAEAADRVADRTGMRSVDVRGLELDVVDEASRSAFVASVVRAGPVDILINNAGVALDGFDARVARDTIATNFTGPMALTDALLPHLGEGARVVNVSSGIADRTRLSRSLREALGDASLTRAGLADLMQRFVDDVASGHHAREGWPTSAYCVSKIGLNRLTELYAAELAGDPRRILVNAACPGWVRTDMGGPGAPLSPEEGADTPVWLALLPAGGPSGGFFRDRAPASW